MGVKCSNTQCLKKGELKAESYRETEQSIEH